ncbi:hypothetical protein [Streptomyces subrutilus]|nr:hypothetical protein [Streptomyces subrutilus]
MAQEVAARGGGRTKRTTKAAHARAAAARTRRTAADAPGTGTVPGALSFP